jgi:integrase
VGVWHYVNLRTFDRNEALRVLAELRQRAAKGEWHPKVRSRENITLKEFLPEALRAIAPSVKKRTLDGYEAIATKFIAVMGDRPLKSITTRDLTAFIQIRRDEKRKSQTLRNDLFALSAIFQVARQEDHGYMDRNPVRDMEKKPRVERAVPRPLSDLDVMRILKAADERRDFMTPLILRLVINTGLRAGELHGLAWDDVDLGEKLIRLKPGKNYRGRVIPLNRHALDVLGFLTTHMVRTRVGEPQRIVRRQTQHMKYVFCWPDGGTLALAGRSKSAKPACPK